MDHTNAAHAAVMLGTDLTQWEEAVTTLKSYNNPVFVFRGAGTVLGIRRADLEYAAVTAADTIIRGSR